ncbi:MAG: hypothetical protein LBV37_01645, partial [Mycoplasmataceae bacterium]|nr:hypothetical protein [Mycoplasmataceae bacterium]
MAVNNKKELSKLSKNLNLIFTSPVFANALKAPAFQVIIEKQLNILNFLESKNSVTKPITPDFIIKYNTITAKKFSIDSKVNYADLGEMVDDINYLEVYIKNIF